MPVAVTVQVVVTTLASPTCSLIFVFDIIADGALPSLFGDIRFHPTDVANIVALVRVVRAVEAVPMALVRVREGMRTPRHRLT